MQDFRGTYNVRDYRWFNLRDSKTGDAGVFQNSGLLEDDYDEKPGVRGISRAGAEVHRGRRAGRRARRGRV